MQHSPRPLYNQILSFTDQAELAAGLAYRGTSHTLSWLLCWQAAEPLIIDELFSYSPTMVLRLEFFTGPNEDRPPNISLVDSGLCHISVLDSTLVLHHMSGFLSMPVISGLYAGTGFGPGFDASSGREVSCHDIAEMTEHVRRLVVAACFDLITSRRSSLA